MAVLLYKVSKFVNIRTQIILLVFIQELKFARTRACSCISQIHTLNSMSAGTKKIAIFNAEWIKVRGRIKIGLESN